MQLGKECYPYLLEQYQRDAGGRGRDVAPFKDSVVAVAQRMCPEAILTGVSSVAAVFADAYPGVNPEWISGVMAQAAYKQVDSAARQLNQQAIGRLEMALATLVQELLFLTGKQSLENVISLNANQQNQLRLMICRYYELNEVTEEPYPGGVGDSWVLMPDPDWREEEGEAPKAMVRVAYMDPWWWEDLLKERRVNRRNVVRRFNNLATFPQVRRLGEMPRNQSLIRWATRH